MKSNFIVWRREGYNGDLEYLSYDRNQYAWFIPHKPDATRLTYTQAKYQATSRTAEAREHNNNQYIYGYIEG